MTASLWTYLTQHGVLDVHHPLEVAFSEDTESGGVWHSPGCPAAVLPRTVTVNDLVSGDPATLLACGCLDDPHEHPDVYPLVSSRDQYAALWLSRCDGDDPDTGRGQVRHLRHLLAAAPHPRTHRALRDSAEQLHPGLLTAVEATRAALEVTLSRLLCGETYLREVTAHLVSLAGDPELSHRSRATLARRAALGLPDPAGGFNPDTLPHAGDAPLAVVRDAYTRLTSQTSWVWTDEAAPVLGDVLDVVDEPDSWNTVLVRVPALIVLGWADCGSRVVHDGRHDPDTILTALRLTGPKNLDDTCRALLATAV